MSGALESLPFYGTLQRRFRPLLGDGSAAMIVSHGYVSVVRLGSNLVLTRLLAPEAFGVIAIVMSIGFVINQLSDMGLRAYIIRHKDANARLLQTVWTVRFARNLCVAATLFFGAGFFADLYGAPETAWAVRAYAGVIVLQSLTSFSVITTERNRGVVRLSLIEMAVATTNAVVTLVAAIYLRSYWAIIIAMYVSTMISVFISHVVLQGPPVGFRFEKDSFLDLWGFWRVVLPSSMMTIVITQSDKFVLARFFDTAQLGFYYLGAAITSAFVSLIEQYGMRIFFPIFAEANRKSDEEAARVYYAARMRMSLLFALALGGLAGAAPFVTRLLFNDEYLGAAVYISILTFLPLGKLLGAPANHALITKGYLVSSIHVTLIRFFWVVLTAPAAYFLFGPFAVFVAIALVELATLPFFWWKTHSFHLLDIRKEFAMLGVFATGWAIGAAISRGVRLLVEQGVLPAF